MPSLAIPPTVVSSLPSAAIAQAGPSIGNPAPDASSAASGGEVKDGGVFAALLGLQMAGAATPAADAPVALIAATDQQTTQVPDPLVQPVDLSVLLQGLLLPISTRPDGVQVGSSSSVSAGEQGVRPVLASLGQVPRGAEVATEVLIQAVLEDVTGSSALEEGSPGFAEVIADAARQAASDAAIGGKTAEFAARELPQQAAQLESQPIAHMVSHAHPEPARIERQSLLVPTPVTSPNWYEDLGSKLTMLIGKEAASAELVLTPPHLGRVEVQLSVNGDQTSASFVAATPAAREALEQALPKLREFLADAGIDLTQASVAGDTHDGRRNADGNHRNRSGQGGDSPVVTDITPAPAPMRRIDGMVDTFA